MSGAPPARPRRRWPRWLLAGLLVLPVVEIVLLVLVGREIGVLWTVLLLLVSTVVGVVLLVREVPRSWRGLREALGMGPAVVVDGTRVTSARGRPAGVPAVSRQIVDGGLVLVGALLILVPGLLTDVAGILCLLPVTRAVPRRLLGALIERRTARFVGAVRPPGSSGPPTPGPREVLRGEVVDPPPADRLRKD